jgi:hypothetical protein
MSSNRIIFQNLIYRLDLSCQCDAPQGKLDPGAVVASSVHRLVLNLAGRMAIRDHRSYMGLA